jgi:hypothetical protein
MAVGWEWIAGGVALLIFAFLILWVFRTPYPDVGRARQGRRAGATGATGRGLPGRDITPRRRASRSATLTWPRPQAHICWSA